MKFAALLLLAGFCLLLGGCSQMPAQMTGPQGAGSPLPMSDDSGDPQQSAGLLARPMSRRRRNAAAGRAVAPSDNAACGGKACGCGCDYPLWLLRAQEHEGEYLGCNMAARGKGGLPLKFAHFAAELAGQGSVLAPLLGGREPDWGGLFTDWCLAAAADPKTGRGRERLAKGAAAAENWLNYGAAAQPCFGALMAARQNGGYMLAFCVGALSVAQGKSEQAQRVYLGLGVKAVMSDSGEPLSQIGLAAFAAEDIAAFRLPRNYRPCKEHYKLEQTVWSRQFQAKLDEKRRQAQIILPPEEARIAAEPERKQIAGEAAGAAAMGAAAQPVSANAVYADAAPQSGAGRLASEMRDWDLESAIERDLQAGLNRDFSAAHYV